VQAAAHARQQTLPETQMLHGKTKPFVPPAPKTVTSVPAANAGPRNRGPAHTQVNRPITSSGAGPRIVKPQGLTPSMVAAAIRPSRQPRQPPLGRRGEPAPVISCPYRPLRVDDLNDYRPARVSPVDDYIPMRIPPADDGYTPMRAPDCGCE
jgi:hypothetical protein